MQNKNIAKIFLLFSVLFAGGVSYAQTDKNTLHADKKAVLESLASAQQKQMQSRSSYLKNFPFFTQNILLANKYKDEDTFKKTKPHSIKK